MPDGDIDKKIVASGFPSAVAVQDRYHIHDFLWENLERCHYKRPRTWQVRGAQNEISAPVNGDVTYNVTTIVLGAGVASL